MESWEQASLSLMRPEQSDQIPFTSDELLFPQPLRKRSGKQGRVKIMTYRQSLKFAAAFVVTAPLMSFGSVSSANATDVMRLLATVAHHQAEQAGSNLEATAERKTKKTTNSLQNAENVRSQAEKRLETQRRDLTRNWAG
jgi:hypothetical protein